MTVTVEDFIALERHSGRGGIEILISWETFDEGRSTFAFGIAEEADNKDERRVLDNMAISGSERSSLLTLFRVICNN